MSKAVADPRGEALAVRQATTHEQDVLAALEVDLAQDHPAEERSAPGLLGPYVGYVGYFVGAGLISGGIVHYPLAPGRYAAVALVGVLLFAAATVWNEVVLQPEAVPRSAAVRLVGASLLLSLGIGMLSGGIQHYTDFPARSATLIPAGLALSFVAFHLRQGAGLKAALLGRVGAGLLVLVVGGYAALQAVVPADVAAAHGHGPAPAAASDGHPEPAGGPAAQLADPHATALVDRVEGAQSAEAPPGPEPTGPVSGDLQRQLEVLEELEARLADLSAS